MDSQNARASARYLPPPTRASEPDNQRRTAWRIARADAPREAVITGAEARSLQRHDPGVTAQAARWQEPLCLTTTTRVSCGARHYQRRCQRLLQSTAICAASCAAHSGDHISGNSQAKFGGNCEAAVRSPTPASCQPQPERGYEASIRTTSTAIRALAVHHTPNSVFQTS